VFIVPEDGEEPFGVVAKGVIPSRERALDAAEVAYLDGWVDTAEDRAWLAPDLDTLLGAMDRFHPLPDAPEWNDGWSEWLYFNGRAGEADFYLTFLVGSPTEPGLRAAGGRLQLSTDEGTRAFSDNVAVDAEAVLRTAPNLTIGSSHVRLEDAATGSH